jgi:Holliday junction resolvasome RuvABC endonuclease subunit
VTLLVCATLGLSESPPPDAADALALAITHLRVAPLIRAVARLRPAKRPF